MASRCSVCGETTLDTWVCCPACGHPYPDDPSHDDDDDEDCDDDDDPDDLA